MGTRHRQAVIAKDGELKLQQYGQWDGYPEGQGIQILEYLKSGNLDKYQENLSKIPLITDEQSEVVDKDENWTKRYPYLSRDCGSNIHQMIEDGTVKFVSHIDEEEAQKWCEGFYTIDFKNNQFISEFYDVKSSFPLDNLPTEKEYLEIMIEEEDEVDE